MYTDDSDYYYEYDYYSDPYMDTFHFCVIPTLYQTVMFMIETLPFSLLYLLGNRLTRNNLKRHHIISFTIGFCQMVYFAWRNGFEAFFLIPLNILSYLCLKYYLRTKAQKPRVGFALLITLIGILILLEFTYDHDAWLKVRSIMMIAMMKILSVGIDASRKQNMRDFLSYIGYVWCPANLVLGPWHSYMDYITVIYKPKPINRYWFVAVCKYIVGALSFVTLSNCINAYLIDDSYNNFLVAYRQASSFRMSHYFVSFMGSAGMILAGYNQQEGYDLDKWEYSITKPTRIELPRSLVNVVIYWNIPTHTFLKQYIFKDFLPYGRFLAIFMTYVVSSMLHGLNVEISMVLLTLGIFSYFQFKFQEVVAAKLNICALARECRQCSHKREKHHTITRMFIGIFSLITIIYLAYIGCLMESVDTSTSTLNIIYGCVEKWSSLLFIGHVLILLSYLFTKCFSRL